MESCDKVVDWVELATRSLSWQTGSAWLVLTAPGLWLYPWFVEGIPLHLLSVPPALTAPAGNLVSGESGTHPENARVSGCVIRAQFPLDLFKKVDERLGRPAWSTPA